MNWGNKLLITFIVFAGMMSTLVYKALHTDFELVEKEYYKSELKFQEVIDGTNRANALNGGIKLSQQNDVVSLQLPAEMKGATIQGNIWFYCSYNARQDKKFVMKVNSDAIQEFPAGAVRPGNYLVKVSWEKDGLNYYTEKGVQVQ